MNQSTIYGISMRSLPADFRSAYGESFRSRRAFRRHAPNRRSAEPSNPRACRGRFDSHSEARLQIRQSAFPVRDCETRCQLDAISGKYLVWPLRKAASKTAFSISRIHWQRVTAIPRCYKHPRVRAPPACWLGAGRDSPPNPPVRRGRPPLNGSRGSS